MSESSLLSRLGVFRAWQDQRLQQLDRFHDWLRQQDLLTPEADATIGNARQTLGREYITIAVVGEFSRGKTELINALFFSDYGCRLLPSNPGRTTMCPTEIFCDPARPPFIRLMPIETRLSERSLGELCEDDRNWDFEALDTASPQNMAEQCMALTETTEVTRQDAERFGLLFNAKQDDELIEVPRWRMAQLNLHHPLLQTGLRILDTPGLNAIGAEPELTYQMLPSAHATLFVLAADTGVTRSDLDIWHELTRSRGQQGPEQTIIVLNKTDTLWDELRSSREVAGNIIRQCQYVARQLDVSADQVFAASAQKALLARIRRDDALWQRTGIGGLQRHLSETMSSDRKSLLLQANTRMVLETIDVLNTVIGNRINETLEQQRKLQALADDSDQLVQERLAQTQKNFECYQQDVDAYSRSIEDFRKNARTALGAIDPGLLDVTLEDIRRQMSDAWTTQGLKQAMQLLVEKIDERMTEAAQGIRGMRQKLRSLQSRLRRDNRNVNSTPPMLSMIRHQVELRLLDDEAEAFRTSARAALMEQHFLVNHYFKTIVSRARQIVELAHEETRHWSMAAIAPFEDATRQYRAQLAEEISQLRRTGKSRRTVYRRIQALQRDLARLRQQAATLQSVGETFTRQAPITRSDATEAPQSPAGQNATPRPGSKPQVSSTGLY